MKSCRVGNHVFLLVCGVVEIDFFWELLSMTIEYVVKTRKSLAPGQTDKTTGKLWYYKVTLLLLHEPTNPRIFHVLLYF